MLKLHIYLDCYFLLGLKKKKRCDWHVTCVASYAGGNLMTKVAVYFLFSHKN